MLEFVLYDIIKSGNLNKNKIYLEGLIKGTFKYIIRGVVAVDSGPLPSSIQMKIIKRPITIAMTTYLWLFKSNE